MEFVHQLAENNAIFQNVSEVSAGERLLHHSLHPLHTTEAARGNISYNLTSNTSFSWSGFRGGIFYCGLSAVDCLECLATNWSSGGALSAPERRQSRSRVTSSSPLSYQTSDTSNTMKANRLPLERNRLHNRGIKGSLIPVYIHDIIIK